MHVQVPCISSDSRAWNQTLTSTSDATPKYRYQRNTPVQQLCAFLLNLLKSYPFSQLFVTHPVLLHVSIVTRQKNTFMFV